MNVEIEHVWYASYGSNLLESRFHCYILGGQPEGSTKIYKGCNDKTLPISNEKISINSELYFAKKSKTWNFGGVAFINTDFNDQVQTLGRMYLITLEQFIDVIKQENNHEGELFIDFEKAERLGSIVFKEKSWYGNLIYLGDQIGYPIFTFTNKSNIDEQHINSPNEKYLLTIMKGLSETYNFSGIHIKEYFKSKIGIKDCEIEKKLTELTDLI